MCMCIFVSPYSMDGIVCGFFFVKSVKVTRPSLLTPHLIPPHPSPLTTHNSPLPLTTHFLSPLPPSLPPFLPAFLPRSLSLSPLSLQLQNVMTSSPMVSRRNALVVSQSLSATAVCKKLNNLLKKECVPVGRFCLQVYVRIFPVT